MKDSNSASNRIPITPELHERLREFRNGLGGSFDQALEVLLNLAIREGEDEYSAGKRLRSEQQESKQKAD